MDWFLFSNSKWMFLTKKTWMHYGFPRFYTHLKLTYFVDFDKSHHFWSLITNLKLLKQQVNLQNSKCRVRDRVRNGWYIFYLNKNQKVFDLLCFKKDFSGIIFQVVFGCLLLPLNPSMLHNILRKMREIWLIKRSNKFYFWQKRKIQKRS